MGLDDVEGTGTSLPRGKAERAEPVWPKETGEENLPMYINT